jgi:hypothetical protein
MTRPAPASAPTSGATSTSTLAATSAPPPAATPTSAVPGRREQCVPVPTDAPPLQPPPRLRRALSGPSGPSAPSDPSERNRIA